MPDLPALVVSCEHGGNRVPERYREIFAGREELLESHRGWDPGALPLARAVARELHAPLLATRITRLLVETNRSPHHPRLFSEISRTLPRGEKERILRLWYRPHRESVAAEVARGIASRGWTLHLAVHTFTPVLEGRVRDVEIGLLYDPRRKRELRFCRMVGRDLRRRFGPEGAARRAAREAARREALLAPQIRMNQPYRGSSDGLTTWLRTRFSDSRYAGIELEVSQGLTHEGGHRWRRIRTALLECLRALSFPPLLP